MIEWGAAGPAAISTLLNDFDDEGHPMPQGSLLETITSEEARRVIDAAAAKATEIGQPMDIVVVDAGCFADTEVPARLRRTT